ncbi:hypothetical protein LZ554_008914 [Drepanopeziza brunnea f. sp. 'monogermtubi']|nr:hypothetical protein LZ554_008914 [Drepanopeziza brunnea f. sp. 'monogermtubi']
MEYWAMYAEEIKRETIRTPPPDDQPVVANPKESKGHSMNDSYLLEGRQRYEEKLLAAAEAARAAGARKDGGGAAAGTTEEGGTRPKAEDESQARSKKAKKGLCGCDLM